MLQHLRPKIDVRPLIRVMQNKHLIEVLPIERLCFVHPWTIGDFERALASDQHLFVATVEQRVLGYVRAKYQGDTALIMAVAVDPTFQRNGIGRKLLEHAATLNTEVRAWVRESNLVGQQFLRGCGLRWVKTQTRYYSDGEAGYEMVRGVS